MHAIIVPKDGRMLEQVGNCATVLRARMCAKFKCSSMTRTVHSTHCAYTSRLALEHIRVGELEGNLQVNIFQEPALNSD